MEAPAQQAAPAPAGPSADTRDAWYPASKRNVSIVRELVKKDFKLKYRRSVLGVAWSVLNPLLMMVVMAVVFTQMGASDASIPNFPIYLIVGNTVFTFMTDATNQGMSSIISAAPLLKKVKISRWVFPVQKVLFSGVNYLLSMVAVALVMVFYRWTPSIYLLYFPLFLVYLSVFCAGLSLLLSAAAVFFRDVIHLWGVIITAWTYATPIFYSITILPEWLQRLELWNPMYLLITYARDLMLWRCDPGLGLNLRCACMALVSLALGMLVFHKNEHRFILYI